ncbi:helix-turn-helix domain-containing protein [Nonomuraea sp. NPDC049400]|uniref:helix-turn-helix domain-containing protein n=1 Tax=Nonomuraea sp. NPDC049400 TaxID=3364352 RepID=UPI0037BD9FD9
MVGSDSAHGLERFGRGLVLTPGLTVFAEDRAAAVTHHAHPAWKVVLSQHGHAEVRRKGHAPLRAAGLIVPPQLAHVCLTSGPYVAVFLDAWRGDPWHGAAGPLSLEQATVRRLLDAARLHHDADLPSLRAELTPLLGGPPVLDQRMEHALNHLAEPVRLADLAAEVGLSTSRLRALARSAVGVPLARLRQWARLRTAVAHLAEHPPATAAHVAGFADQPHLTRLARRMVGRTPRSLKAAIDAPGHAGAAVRARRRPAW